MALFSILSAQNNKQTSTSSPITVTYPSATTVGNTLIITVVTNESSTATATGFTNYSQAVDGGNAYLTILYGISTGQTTVSVVSTGATVMQAHGYEFNGGANPLVVDTRNKQSSSTTAETTYSTAAITTTLTPDLIFVAMGFESSAGISSTWTTSTLLEVTNRLYDGYYIPGAIETNWTDSLSTFTSTQVGAITIAFQSIPTGNFLAFM